MQHRFFALISRMRYIGRWGLMRNTFEENIQEHSHMVAVLAHGLALIQRDILHEPADPDRCASAALFHDASEILTGDLPTPIKYYNPEIRTAYKAVEHESARVMASLQPAELQAETQAWLTGSVLNDAERKILKAADRLSAIIKNISLAFCPPESPAQGWFISSAVNFMVPSSSPARLRASFSPDGESSSTGERRGSSRQPGSCGM